MILQIIHDAQAFLLILAIAVAGMASAFFAMLQRADFGSGASNPFRNPGHALFNMFNMLLIGK
jgi:hypothetical protein